MSNKVLLKKSSVSAKVPLITDLDYGELALNYADGKLYFKNSSNSIDFISSASGNATLTNKTLTSPTINNGTISGTFTGNATFSGIITFSGGDTDTSSIKLAGYNSRGGTGYHGFLEVTNTYSLATNPNKFLRLDSAGTLQIVNSAYTANIFNLTDDGVLTIPQISAAGSTGINGQFLQSTGTGLKWAYIPGGIQEVLSALTPNKFIKTDADKNLISADVKWSEIALAPDNENITIGHASSGGPKITIPPAGSTDPVIIGGTSGPKITIPPAGSTDPVIIGGQDVPIKIGNLDPWHIVYTDNNSALATSDAYRIEPPLDRVDVTIGGTSTQYQLAGAAFHLKARRIPGEIFNDGPNPDTERASLYFVSTVTDTEIANWREFEKIRNASRRMGSISFWSTPALGCYPQDYDATFDGPPISASQGTQSLTGIDINPFYNKANSQGVHDHSDMYPVHGGLGVWRRQRFDDSTNGQVMPDKTRMTLNLGGFYDQGGRMGYHLMETNDGALKFHDDWLKFNTSSWGASHLLIETLGIASSASAGDNQPNMHPGFTGRWVSQYSAYQRTANSFGDLGDYAEINEPVTYFGFSVKPTTTLGPPMDEDFGDWSYNETGKYNPNGTKQPGTRLASRETWERTAAHPIVAWNIDRKTALRGAKWEKHNNIKGDVRIEAESENVFTSTPPTRVAGTDYGTGLFFPDGTRQYTAWNGLGSNASLHISGTQDEIEITGPTNNVYTIGLPDNVVITGNLTVNGTTTTINSTTITVDDKNIELGSIASPTDTTADGGGITLKGTSDKTFNWVNATGYWTSNVGLSAPKLISTVATGTAPFTVASTTLVTNLNADMLDGQHGSYYASASSIGNGTLSVSIGTAGATNTTVTWGTSSGFSANTSSNYSYDLKVGPALTNLATLMSSGNTGYIKRTGQDTYSIDTSTYLTSQNNDFGVVTIGADSGYTWGAANTNTSQTADSIGDTLTFVNGGAINLYTNTVAGTDAIKIEHADTSTASNLSASGRTYVTGLTFDTYGHVTGYTTGTETVTDTNTVTRLRGTASGTYTSGDLTLVAGSNVTITQSGTDYTIAATQPTVGSGTLGVSIGTAGATNTTVTWGTSSGFNANTSSNYTYDLKVGPALTNLAALMTTAGAGFIKRGATADTYTIDTNTYLTTESDTLATVTGRGASTSTLSTFSGGIIASAGIYGAASGAPDVPIWMVSPANPTWGIFYNEGTPDYIEFKANGTVTCSIALDNGNITTSGSLYATSKSFLINHPTKEGMKLRYGSLESPYHGVRLTGEAVISGDTCKIDLPDYIHGLCKQEGAQVQITNIKHGKILWVDDISVNEDYFIVGMDRGMFDKKEYKFYWTFTGIRKDISDLVVEE